MKTIVKAAVKTDSRFDILKFVMALMIVALHTALWPDVLLPWLRIGVPVFFILSSYFFFNKVDKIENHREALSALKHFIKRSGILYLFWFVVLFIPTMMIRGWFDDGIISGIKHIAYGAVFDSTFVASWFITANIIATSLIFFLRRFPILSFIISLTLFLVCCASACYYGAFPVFNKWLLATFPGYTFYFSFPAAMLWIWIGERVAHCGVRGRWQWWAVLLAVGIVLMWLEYKMVNTHHWMRDSDVMLSLLAVCPAVFMLVRSLPAISFTKSIILRRSSVIFYCVHATVARLILYHFRSLHQHEWWQGPFTFSVTILCCALATWIILTLSRRKYFGWLKYSY